MRYVTLLGKVGDANVRVTISGELYLLLCWADKETSAVRLDWSSVLGARAPLHVPMHNFEEHWFEAPPLPHLWDDAARQVHVLSSHICGISPNSTEVKRCFLRAMGVHVNESIRGILSFAPADSELERLNRAAEAERVKWKARENRKEKGR